MPEVGSVNSCDMVNAEKVKEQIADTLHGLKTDEGRGHFLWHILLKTDLPVPGIAKPLIEDMINEEVERATIDMGEDSLFGGLWQPSMVLNRALIMAKRAGIEDKIEEIEGKLKHLVEEDMRKESPFDEIMGLFTGSGKPKEETKESLEKLLEVLLIVNPERAFEVALKLGKAYLAKKLASNKVFLDWEKRGEFRRIAEACGQIGDAETAKFYASMGELLEKHSSRGRCDCRL